MSNEVLTGQKTILVPLTPIYAKYYQTLMETEGTSIIGMPAPLTDLTRGWLVKTKEGRAVRNVGIIVFTPITNIGVMLQMIIDIVFAKNLENEIKKRYTYVEDGLVTAIEHIFDIEFVYHIEALLFKYDRTSNALLSKIGFEKVGVLNKVIKIDDEIKDMIILTLVKETLEQSSESEKIVVGSEAEIISEQIETEQVATDLPATEPITEPKEELKFEIADKQLVDIGIVPLKKEG